MENRFELSHLKLIVDTVFDANNPTVMGTQFTQLLVSSLGVKGASVFVVNPGKEALEILATEGLSINYLNKGPILTDQSIRLPGNLKPVIIPDTRTSDQLQYPDKAEEEGIRSIISLPVNLRGKIIGALRVYHSDPWEVSDNDLMILNLLTRYLGMALRYFRLATAVTCAKDTLDDIHPIWL
ncbi:MAG: GAF domain-containing protein [Desulfobacterales bacterium]|nr:GAF domain-containing protein [Desulfobacterales bacterium]